MTGVDFGHAAGVRVIPESEASLHLPRLLDDVERGETIVITRDGRPVARLLPEGRRQADIEAALADLEALRARVGRMTTEEILAARHEGHKY